MGEPLGTAPWPGVPSRFAPHALGFTTHVSAQPSGNVHTARVWGAAESVVELLHRLTSYLDAAVDVSLVDRRRERTWSAGLLPLREVRDVVGRLRLPLAAYGDVELSVFTADDQLTLTAEGLLVVYARTGRWLPLLVGFGCAAHESAPQPVWRPWAAPRSEAPSLVRAIDAAVERLGLVEVTP